jgi:FkbM family methyltransferase
MGRTRARLAVEVPSERDPGRYDPGVNEGCDVSVVVPVFNKARFLPVLLDSLAAQDVNGITFDVICVDDGSTDGSGEILDRYAARHSWLGVIHQPNSGWPGQPRNRAVAESTSRYIFFADADDYLGSEALRRMVTWADEYGCDILVPRSVRTSDPYAPFHRLFHQNRPDVPIPLQFKSLGPTKLFRRDFLNEHNLRFVEYRAPLEDGMFTSRAYLLANRVSSVADYAYYYIVDGQETSISTRRRDPWEQRRSVETILRTIRELCPDPKTADQVYLDIYIRKGIRYIAPNRLPNYEPEFRKEHVLAAADLAEACMPKALEEQLPLAHRFRSRLVRHRDAEACYQLALAELSGPPPVRVQGNRLVLDTGVGRSTVDVTDEVALRVDDARIKATQDGAAVAVQLITQGIRLISRETLVLAATGAGGESTRLATATVTTGQTPDALELTAGLTATVLKAAAALPSPVRLAVEIQSREGMRVLAATARAPVDFGSVLAGRAELRRAAAKRLVQFLPGRVTRRVFPPRGTPLLGDGVFVSSIARVLGHTLRRAGLHVTELDRGAVVVSRRSGIDMLPIRRGLSMTVDPGLLHRPTESPAGFLTSVLDPIPALELTTTEISRRAALVTQSSSRVAVREISPGTTLVTEPSLVRRHRHDQDAGLSNYLIVQQILNVVQLYGVNVVLDVGANRGQYARSLRRAGYRGYLVSFEPVRHDFEELSRRAARDPKWTVHQLALGRAEGSIDINVAPSGLSSALPPSEYGGQRYQKLTDATTETVRVVRLDEILDEVLAHVPAPRPYLKLDTQGFDLEVFAGLGERAKDVVGMQSEVALLRIYEGMPRMTESLAVYEAAGFEVAGMYLVTRERRTARALEFDCLMVRADALESDAA